MAETKEWYDGYRFGDTNIYCPWDVISYVDHISADPYAEPEAFWINTSGNDLILQIQEWFRERMADDEKPMREFCRA